MAWFTPDWSDDDVTRTIELPQPASDDSEWTAPTLEIPNENTGSDWAVTMPRPVPPGPVPLPLPRVALPSRIPVPPISPFPRVAPPPRKGAAPRIAPLPPLAPVPRAAPPPPPARSSSAALPPPAPPPRPPMHSAPPPPAPARPPMRSAPPPPARSSMRSVPPPPAPVRPPMGSVPPPSPLPKPASTPPPPVHASAPPPGAELPPVPAFSQQAEAHFPPPPQQASVEPPVVVHNTAPPPAASFAVQQGPTSPAAGAPQASVPPPAGALQASVPPPAQLPFTEPAPRRWKLRLSNSALAFIAFYLVAAAVLVIVLLARHGSGPSQAPTVTATDMQKQPISIASVFVDGHEVCGALPCELPDSSGSHWVSIRAAGYVAPDPVEVSGNVPVHFTLRRIGAAAPVAAAAPTPKATPAPAPSTRPAPSASEAAQHPAATTPAPAPAPAPRRHVWHSPARLSFFSSPSSLVLLDGRPLGRTPRTGVRVSPGHHSVLFVRGSRRIARRTWARAGRNLRVSAHF